MNNTTLALLAASLTTGAFTAIIRRSKRLAIFQTILLSIHAISSSLNFSSIIPLPLFVYLNAVVYIQWFSLGFPSLKPNLWRLLVSFPNIYYSSCTIFGFFLTPVILLYPPAAYIPLTLCFVGFIQTVGIKKQELHIDLTTPPTEKLTPLKDGKSPGSTATRTLRICQITDPHLGPSMSPDRLRYICDQIVEWNPDLVLLTGDNITIESYFAVEGFARAYEPLKKLTGRTFACLGNHDYESLDTVETAHKNAQILLLKDEETTVNTVAGPVQIIGTEFSFGKGRALQRIPKIAHTFPRKEDHLRIFLVHNPEEFVHFPDGDADIVFSGHTHGGQLGLYSLGIHWTLYNFFTKMPDFGLWGKGKNRLYVHRGTGHYGFPIRMGVPNELSLIHLHY